MVACARRDQQDVAHLSVAIGWDGSEGVHSHLQTIHERGISASVQVAPQLADVNLLHSAQPG